MNQKYINVLFLCIVSSLIFINIPQNVQMMFLGGSIGNKLVFYPLFIGFIYTVCSKLKKKNKLTDYRVFFQIYIYIYLTIVMISLLLGLAYNPYWNDMLSAPTDQIEKMSRLLEFFEANGLDFNVKMVTCIWIIVRQLKVVLLDALWGIGGAYIIYLWYKDDWQQGLNLMINSCLVSISIIILYSFIELPYLMHNNYAALILQEINPYIHVINMNGTWYPPLLCEGQLRSIFSEPSHFGIYSAFVLPFLWYKLIKNKSILYGFLTFIMTFLLFLTKARTGFMLHVGQLFLLVVGTLIFIRNIKPLKNVVLVLSCSFIAFISSNYFISNYMDINVKNTAMEVAVEETETINKAMSDYVDSNMGSLANPDKRSNRARYSIMEADLKIGLDHPVLGVGMGLRNCYIPDYLSEKGKQNGEVKMWISFREKLGIMRSGFPKLGEYTSRFGETGILGLTIFLFPPLFLLWNLAKKIKADESYRLEYITFMVSLLGIMASGIGDTLNITYCYWVLLGFGYAMCFGEKVKE